MAAGLVDDSPDVVLRMAMSPNQLAIPFRLLQRIEVLALYVLDQRELGRGGFVDFADDGGDAVEPRPLCRAPSPLAGDDHVILTERPEQDWLKNAALPDRIGELIERIFVELDPGLFGIGPDSSDFNLAHSATRSRLIARGCHRPRSFAQKRLQPHAEALGRTIRAHAATASCGSRPISSRASRR